VCHRNCTLVLASGVKGLIELSVRHRLAGETLVQVPKSLLSSLSERLQSHARDYMSTPRLPQLLPANCNCEASGHLRASEIACGVIDELVPNQSTCGSSEVGLSDHQIEEEDEGLEALKESDPQILPSPIEWTYPSMLLLWSGRSGSP